MLYLTLARVVPNLTLGSCLCVQDDSGKTWQAEKEALLLQVQQLQHSAAAGGHTLQQVKGARGVLGLMCRAGCVRGNVVYFLAPRGYYSKYLVLNYFLK